MAVYVHITAEQFRHILSHYAIGELLSFKGITEGIENTNYKIETTHGSYIVTLYGKRVNPQHLPFYLGFMEHLAQHTIPCPTPIHTKKGELVHTHEGQALTIVSFLAGASVRSIQNQHCATLGEMLGKIHTASASFTAPIHKNPLDMHYWQKSFDACESAMDGVNPHLRTAVKEGMQRVYKEWPTTLPVGVIHADLFPDNVLWQEQSISGMIDFYAACHDLFVYDLAICMNSWCFENTHEFNVTKARAMLQGYCKARNLTAAERNALPIIAVGAALRFLCSRLYDYVHRVEGAVVITKDPIEYLNKLRFHLQVKNYQEYGL